MKIDKIWILLLIAVIALLPSCQRNEGNALLIAQTIPFPNGASDRRLFVDQPDPDYHHYIAYLRCTVSKSEAERYLEKLGFKTNEFGFGTFLSAESFPDKIKAWWTPLQAGGETVWTKRLDENG